MFEGSQAQKGGASKTIVPERKQELYFCKGSETFKNVASKIAAPKTKYFCFRAKAKTNHMYV